MFEDLKKRAYEANMALYRYGIAPFTWGNASECDRSSGVFAIKPSGVPYEQLTPEKMVIVDFDGHRIEGAYNPSSDTPTHAVLFSRFPSIGGVVHTRGWRSLRSERRTPIFAGVAYPVRRNLAGNR